MNINVEIIRFAPRQQDSVDYQTTLFKIDLNRKLDLETANDYWIFFKTMIDGGGLKIIVDMKNLDYIDSSGIGILINSAKLLRKSRGDIVLINVSAGIKDILKIVNLQDFIKIFNLEAEALNFFRYL